MSSLVKGIKNLRVQEWRTPAVSHLFEIGRGRVISHDDIANKPGPYPVFSSQTLDDGVMGTMGSFDYEGEYLTWTTDGAQAGTVFHRTGRFSCTNVCGTLKARDSINVDCRFFAYALGTITQEYVRYDINPKLMSDVMGRIRIRVPDISTQNIIAAYLDRETTRLDQLVKAKEGLLELLAEKRRALIARAVTRGLDPKAPLRDTGFDWLGKIPKHWDLERSKWLFQERDERSVTGEEEMLTVSHITGVTPRSEKNVNMFEAESNEGCKLCQPGDLVINTLWAWMGAMGTARVPGMVSPAYNVYCPNERLLPDYVDALVRIPAFAQVAIRFSKGVWSSRLRLYPEGLYEIWFPVPPLTEQRAIVSHIAAETAKLDALRASAERTIRLLKERRSALISAAVTGKIDLPKVIENQ